MSTAPEGSPATTTARTDPSSPDLRLRGRTYAISFDRVWQAALEVTEARMGRWHVLHWDDQEGVIEVEATSLVLRVADRVVIDVGLDENAQTRVDMSVATPRPYSDLGRGRRLVRRFFRRLDATVGAGPAQILDVSRQPSWST